MAEQSEHISTLYRQYLEAAEGRHARLQLLTIEDLLTGKGIDRAAARTSTTFKRAPQGYAETPERKRLEFDTIDPDRYSG